MGAESAAKSFGILRHCYLDPSCSLTLAFHYKGSAFPRLVSVQMSREVVVSEIGIGSVWKTAAVGDRGIDVGDGAAFVST